MARRPTDLAPSLNAGTRDSKGKLRKTNNCYIEFVAVNGTVREATDFINQTDAAEFLEKRISDALGGKIVLSRNVTYDDLRDLIITDYTNNGRTKSRPREPPRQVNLRQDAGDEMGMHMPRSAPFVRVPTRRFRDMADLGTRIRQLV
jgi:hypothetical protein